MSIYIHWKTILKRVLPKHATMNKVYFRRAENDDKIRLNFSLNHEKSRVNKTFNFNRNCAERIGSTLQKIRLSCEKEFNKRNKKQKNKKQESSVQSELSELTVNLLSDGNPVSNDLTWDSLFSTEHVHSGNLVLQILDEDFQVAYNYPRVEKCELPTVILAGSKCYPSKCDVSFTQVDECRFEWFKSSRPLQADHSEWKGCGDTFFYDVKEDDIGQYLKVRKSH